MVNAKLWSRKNDNEKMRFVFYAEPVKYFQINVKDSASAVQNFSAITATTTAAPIAGTTKYFNQ